MNIIKFYNNPIHIVNPATNETETYLEDLFNTYYKGMYCFVTPVAIYPVCSDSDSKNGITRETYLKTVFNTSSAISYRSRVYTTTEDGSSIPVFSCISINEFNYYKLSAYVDPLYSELYEDTEFYEKINERTKLFGNLDVSIENVRKFRSEVAGIIFAGRSLAQLCPKVESMLQYYMEDMSDTTVEMLTLFQLQNPVSTNTISPYQYANSSSCGCSNVTMTSNGLSNISKLLLNTTTNCDTVKGYRDAMKAYMISVFSDIEFWRKIVNQYPEAITLIIKYLTALIESGMSIFNRGRKLELDYCCETDFNDSNSLYNTYIEDMSAIKETFELLINERVSGEQNTSKDSFMKTQLGKFANYYEYLSWDGYVVGYSGI